MLVRDGPSSAGQPATVLEVAGTTVRIEIDGSKRWRQLDQLFADGADLSKTASKENWLARATYATEDQDMKVPIRCFHISHMVLCRNERQRAGYSQLTGESRVFQPGGHIPLRFRHRRPGAALVSWLRRGGLHQARCGRRVPWHCPLRPHPGRWLKGGGGSECAGGAGGVEGALRTAFLALSGQWHQVAPSPPSPLPQRASGRWLSKAATAWLLKRSRHYWRGVPSPVSPPSLCTRSVTVLETTLAAGQTTTPAVRVLGVPCPRISVLTAMQVRHCLCLVYPLPSWRRRCLCLVCPLPLRLAIAIALCIYCLKG